jgi:hypothetical protein
MKEKNKTLLKITGVYLLAFVIWVFFPPAASAAGAHHTDYSPVSVSTG